MNDQDTTLNINTSVEIGLPLPSSERRMAIRMSDWSRIKREVAAAKRPLPWLPMIYTALFGVSVTAAVSIVPVVQADGLAPWVTPLYVIGAIAALLVCAIFLVLDIRTGSQAGEAIEACLADMGEVENAYSR